ncbi:MAG: YkgJ family cysteine cluster protein [Candidatus Eisenbacteria bacterium]
MIDKGRLRFSCTRCGRCCREPGWVRFTPAEQRPAARALGIPVARFRETHGHDEDGTWIRVTRPKPCPFLGEEGCSIYEARPEQCRTWPFWPENLASKAAWSRIARRCHGARKID